MGSWGTPLLYQQPWQKHAGEGLRTAAAPRCLLGARLCAQCLVHITLSVPVNLDRRVGAIAYG